MYRIMTGYLDFLNRYQLLKTSILFQIDLNIDVAGRHGATESINSMDLTRKKVAKILSGIIVVLSVIAQFSLPLI